MDTFSLGFPPKLIGKRFGETEYVIGCIPLGGYVKMYGMVDESFDDDYDPNDPRGFMAKPFRLKVFIIVAGVIMNVLLGWLIYSVITYYEGLGKMTGTTITLVSPNYPAATAGLEVGDRIIEVDGIKIEQWQQFTEIIRKHPGETLNLKWARGDSVMSVEIIPKATPEFNIMTGKVDTVGKIGVVGTIVNEPVGLIKAFGYGAEQVWWIIRLNVVSISALISGTASLKELTGPLGIAKMSGESARSGLVSFLAFIALISISIAFLNILPIPMLDGGHLVMLFIEKIIRRNIPDKVKLNIMKVGLALLILLVIIVSYNDIIKFYLTGN